MAAGKRGGYRENEYRGCESEVETLKKENGIRRGDYELDGNGARDYEKGQLQAQDRASLEDKGKLRQKDATEMNGGYPSTSSRSDSGSSGGERRKCEPAVVAVDREPGELYSDGSDEADDLGMIASRETDSKNMKTSRWLSPQQTRKRKFSPIIWDRYDRETNAAIKSRSTLDTAPNPIIESPELLKSHYQSPQPKPSNNEKTSAPADDGEINDCEINLEASLSGGGLRSGTAEVPAETYSLQHEGDQRVNSMGMGEVDEDDYAPTRTIVSSRWASDAESPSDEGEISDNESMPKPRSKSCSEHSKSVSPEIGLARQGSETARGRSSRSEERVRSSSRDSYQDNDDNNDPMETGDDYNRDGSRINEPESESEDYPDSPILTDPAQPPQRSVNMLQACRSVDEFERLNKIDEGTYGVVFRAKDKKTGEIVALKKVKMEKEREGFPLTSLREINILLSFDYPSIVDVKEVVVGSNLDSIFMVMEYMEHDLKALMETMKQPFSQSEVKCLMLQLLEGVKYLHDNWVLHRDLKTSNLLLNNRGELKICDFGLARQYGSPLKPYTHLVVTLWYRAPELLMGAKLYSTAIDMWSLGCIMAELLSKEPLFNGKTEVEQLDKIFRILGTPNETIWPGFSELPGVKVNFVKHKYNLLRRKFPATSFTGSLVLSDAGFDLLNRLITYDPDKRITAKAALNHEWFREVPLPKSKEFMPTFPAHGAQDRRTRRVMKSPDPLEEQRRKELQQGEISNGGLFSQ
ncbi:cyclin-dependent kinase G-2-like isoform X1 [Salvia splendens]|uniref:cyclin-dependent kinase G-2-like isoform X1 n=2 Tax=Salvia splendens TaxID=180675 RepID=UPI001C26FD2A|nr:cyclin-dependent kinase G-2-like isoform X1 [Salvia splendens]